ncbi:MAG TPA: histidinol-phosphatase [Blastocatellia bacterium]|nr:histidinol-phosphatase [Blastocatellia bacterium]
MKRGETLSGLLDFAVDAAWQAGKITLEYFQTNLDVKTKSDHSPVTIADKRTEEKLRELIAARFPDDAIAGEEFGETPGSSGYRWIIDPIDGTRSFIHGVGFYGVLVGLEYTGDCVLGVVNLPALNEMVYAAKGLGCHWNGRAASVSPVSGMKNALLLTTDVTTLRESERGAAYERLAREVKMQRSWGDCYGHILVATGRAEIMLDPVMNEWDCAPLLPILQEAGGHFTDWRGVPTIKGGDAISTNAVLFEQTMKTIRQPA